jgi:hypothetical protein
MISRVQIQRMIEIGAWDRLVQRILANGRCRSAAARRRLSEPGSAMVAGIGLALQRLCELTYGPSEIAGGVARRLLRLQRPDGLFEGGPSLSIAASAIAIRGLLDWGEQCGRRAAGRHLRLEGAIERGIAALAAALSRPGRLAPDQVDLEVVLWQLGRDERFRRAIPVTRMAPTGAGSHRRRGGDDLTRFAAAAAA